MILLDANIFMYAGATPIPTKRQASLSLTDRLLLGAYGALDEDAGAALVAGTRALGAALGV